MPAILCIALLSLGNSVAWGQQAEQQNPAPAEEAPKIPKDQLDSLVAPIALYPDPLLAQTLAASTEVNQLAERQLDLELGKRLPRPGARRDGRSSAHARKTFIVGPDGVVYRKDLGPETLKAFEKMDRYNPDKTWKPTDDQWPEEEEESAR
jgi:hypothetical protein